MKQHLNKIFWTLVAILAMVTLVVLLATPSEFDKTHDHYVFQELLMKYSSYKLRHNDNKISKYSSYTIGIGIITLETEDGTGEVYIGKTGIRKKIPNTNVYVKLKYNQSSPDEHIFSVRKDSSEIEKIKEKEKEMSLGTWILIFLLCLLTVKLAHKITWKSLFKPLKKWISKRKDDWTKS